MFRRNVEYLDKEYKDILEKINFIMTYGKYNCGYMVFQNYDKIILKMNEYDKCKFDEQEILFIKDNANKKVLIGVFDSYTEDPDIFVFGDNNIAFRKECFLLKG